MVAARPCAVADLCAEHPGIPGDGPRGLSPDIEFIPVYVLPGGVLLVLYPGQQEILHQLVGRYPCTVTGGSDSFGLFGRQLCSELLQVSSVPGGLVRPEELLFAHGGPPSFGSRPCGLRFVAILSHTGFLQCTPNK